MNNLRSKQETAFQDVIKSLEESIAYLQGTADGINDPLISNTLRTLADLRARCCQSYYHANFRGNFEYDVQKYANPRKTSATHRLAARDLSDRAETLPSTEHASISLLIQRVRDEEQLLNTVKDALELDWSKNNKTTLEYLLAHVQHSVHHLQEVIANLETDCNVNLARKTY